VGVAVGVSVSSCRSRSKKGMRSDGHGHVVSLLGNMVVTRISPEAMPEKSLYFLLRAMAKKRWCESQLTLAKQRSSLNFVSNVPVCLKRRCFSSFLNQLFPIVSFAEEQ
jgi:hypothetical protein